MKRYFAIVLLLAAHTLVAEDIVHIEVKMFDAPEGVPVTKAEIDSGEIKKKAQVLLTSAPKVTAFSGQDATLQVIGADPATGIPTGMILSVKSETIGDRIKYQTRTSTQKVEDARKANGWFEVSGTCEDGESVLFNSKNARTGRMQYFYMLLRKESAANR